MEAVYRMPRRFRNPLIVLVAALSLPGPIAWASCQVERENTGAPAMFVRHLGPDCSKEERIAQAIRADEILWALQAGKGISVRNAVIAGDLLLTRLPSVPVASISLPPSVQDELARSAVTEARVIG